jgi:hypothetical protein
MGRTCLRSPMRSCRKRINCEVHKTEFVAFALILPCTHHYTESIRPGGPICSTSAGSSRATGSGTTAATRRTDRIVSGFAGGTDPRGGYIPDQVVEADRWLQQHTELKGEQLGEEVDKQPWDPSVKALTEFPSVLANMDKNLSWTSSLGDAYVNQQQDVMNAVQVMRARADQAGNLKSTSQENVSKQGQDRQYRVRLRFRFNSRKSVTVWERDGRELVDMWTLRETEFE